MDAFMRRYDQSVGRLAAIWGLSSLVISALAIIVTFEVAASQVDRWMRPFWRPGTIMILGIAMVSLGLRASPLGRRISNSLALKRAIKAFLFAELASAKYEANGEIRDIARASRVINLYEEPLKELPDFQVLKRRLLDISARLNR